MLRKLVLTMLSVGAGVVLTLSNANALLLKANDNEFAKAGLMLLIYAQKNGKVTTNDQNSTNFSVETARLYFNGQINPIVQFGSTIDFADNNYLIPDGSARHHQGVASTIVKDAFVNFKFMPQLQLMTGLFLDPYSKFALTTLSSLIIPDSKCMSVVVKINVDGKSLLGNKQFKPFINPFVPLGLGCDIGSSYRDAGLTLWGMIGKGDMLKYYIMIGNGRYDYEAGNNGKNNLKYGFRLEFSPTMLGYKGSPMYKDKDDYLGSQNTLTFGIGYQQQKIDCSDTWLNSANKENICNGQMSSTIARAYTFDTLWEQKFGNFVPNIQLGWAEQKDLGYSSYKNGNTTVYAQPEATGYYAQAQFLYDKYVGIGKPAIAIRYDNFEDKNYYTYKNSLVNGRISDTYLYLNYYINNFNARLSLGVQFINPNSGLKNATADNGNELKNFTDYTLMAGVVF